MTIGESFVFNGRVVTVLDIERDQFTGEIEIVCLRVAPRTNRYFWGVAIREILAARAASLPGRLS